MACFGVCEAIVLALVLFRVVDTGVWPPRVRWFQPISESEAAYTQAIMLIPVHWFCVLLDRFPPWNRFYGSRTRKLWQRHQKRTSARIERIHWQEYVSGTYLLAFLHCSPFCGQVRTLVPMSPYIRLLSERSPYCKLRHRSWPMRTWSCSPTLQKVS